MISPVRIRLMQVWGAATAAALAAILWGGATARACPFCAVESQTLTEELEGADAAVLARFVKAAEPVDPPAEADTAHYDTGGATFEIVEVLRGQEVLDEGRQIEVVFFGEPNRELFLIFGLGTETIDWTTPLPLSPAAVDYVRQLPTLPRSGPDRLAFMQEYFEHADPLLGQDAYDEFARASYADVQALGPRMHHDRLIGWIQDPEVSPSRRRLYFTMLGVCGGEADVPLLEEMIVSDYESKRPFVEHLLQTGISLGGPAALPSWSELLKQDERRKKLGLDSMIACYLILRGPDGLDLIDERLLKNPNAEYTHIYSAIMALRFHGEESDVLPRDRLLASMRLLLDNPDFADQVIPDLSRWEDWSVLDRLVEMFKDSDNRGFIRQPVVTYLTVASDEEGEVGQRATSALAELEKLDPESVKRARSLMAFGFLGRARAGGESNGATRPENEADSGFAASAADLEAADGDPADIPEPAAFGNGALAARPAVEVDESAGEDAEQEATDQEAGPAAGPAPAEPSNVMAAASLEQRRAVPPASPVTAAVAPEGSPNKTLIIGVPLAAAVLLMAVYWWILRSGAV